MTFHTPRGDLERTYKLDAEGTWSEYGHMVKLPAELDIVRCIVEATRFVPHHERIEKFLRDTEGFGVCDLVVNRSPFGKLIHEYMGFEQVAYALERRPGRGAGVPGVSGGEGPGADPPGGAGAGIHRHHLRPRG